MRNVEKKMAEVSKPPGIVHRFPPTRLLETQYCSIVPDRFQRQTSVKDLASTLAESRERTKRDELPIALPSPPVTTPFSPPYSSSTELSEEEQQLPWAQKVDVLKEKLTNQIAALRQSVYIRDCHLKQTLPAIRNLISASKSCLGQCAEVLCANCEGGPEVECYVRREGVTCASVGVCGQRALPFSRLCLQHINQDSAQVLYRSCEAIDNESLTQCRQPVTDILSEDRLCTKHSKNIGTLDPRLPIRKRPAPGKGKIKTAVGSGLGQKAKKATPTKTKGEGRMGTVKHSAKVQVVQVAQVVPAPGPGVTEASDATPAISAPKRPRIKPVTEHTSSPTPLPSLPSDTLSPPLSTLTTILLPPLPTELGKIMEDSSSGEDS